MGDVVAKIISICDLKHLEFRGYFVKIAEKETNFNHTGHFFVTIFL